MTLDNNSNAFVADATTTRWLWANPQTQQTPTPPWQATSSTEWVGPFSGLQAPRGVVSSGQQRLRRRQWEQPRAQMEGRECPDVVPFTGLNGPDGLAVTYTTGDVWVVDTGNNRVLRLQNFNQPTPLQTVLPFTGLTSPHGVALDTSFHNNNTNAIILFVTDTGNNRVVRS